MKQYHIVPIGEEVIIREQNTLNWWTCKEKLANILKDKYKTGQKLISAKEFGPISGDILPGSDLVKPLPTDIKIMIASSLLNLFEVISEEIDGEDRQLVGILIEPTGNMITHEGRDGQTIEVKATINFR
jgi:hypothetical protein